MSDYTGHASTLIDQSVANSYDKIAEQIGEYYSIFSTGYSEIEFMKYDTNSENTTTHPDRPSSSKNLDSFGGAFFPETVWSLDVSTGAHLENISSELGSEFDTMLGGGYKNTYLWTRAISGLWTDNNADNYSDTLPSLSLQFQVASCGGNAAERSDLEYCYNDGNAVGQDSGSFKKVEQGNDSHSATSINNNGAYQFGSSSTIFTLNLAAQDPFLHMPAGDNNFTLQEDLAVLTDLSGCNDIATCTTTPNTTTLPLIYRREPLDYRLPLGGPVSYSPIYVPPHVASPVPETSTWIMTMIGFALMVFACRRRSASLIKQSSFQTF
jgi:hypothetical protein